METVVPTYILDSVSSLPPLPAAVQRLLSLAKQIDADFQEIAHVIEADQTLTARTLRAANSALYGVARRIQTVRQATVLLGRETILNLAIGASVLGLQGSLSRAWPGDSVAFWRHSIAVASVARELAKHLRLPDPEEAFVAGLLHDIGKLILLGHFGDHYLHVLKAAQYGAKPLYLLEREVLETDHAAVGQALCVHWNIPPTLTQAIAEHHSAVPAATGSTADVVRDANDLVKTIGLGDSGSRFVDLRPVEALPRTLVRPDLVRRLIVELPGEVRVAEEVFAQAEDDEKGEAVAGARRPVHVLVRGGEERDLLGFMLLGMGYEPVGGSELADVPLETAAALVVDGTLSPALRAACRRAEVPVLDYGTWRGRKRVPEGPPVCNVQSLRSWLVAHLPACAAPVAA